MRKLALIFASLVLPGAAVSSCVVATDDHVVAIEEDYVYYPRHHVYYSSAHDHWYVRDGSSWVTVYSPPPSLTIAADVDWVTVRGDRGRPWTRHDRHRSAYPDSYKSDRKGPPPGRGWRK